MPVMRSIEDKPDWVPWSAFGIGEVTDASAFDRHYHDADEYWLVISGRAIVESGGEQYEIAAGDVLCTPMGEEHDVVEVLESPLRCFYIEDALRGQQRPGHLHRDVDGPPERMPSPER